MTVAADVLARAGGDVPVLHRLALAVETIDAATGRPTGDVRVTPVSSRRAGPLDRCGSVHVLRHAAALTTPVTLLLQDTRRAFVPRRLDVDLWSLAEVAARDAADPGAAAPVPARARLVRPWCHPGSGYPVPAGSTGLRLQIRRAGRPVPWARVEVRSRGAGARTLVWAHGDERGEVLALLLGRLDPVSAPLSREDVDLVVHVPAPAQAGPADPRIDPLSGLPTDVLPRPGLPLPDPPNPLPHLDTPATRGSSVPTGYVALPVITTALIVGEIVAEPITV